MAINTDRCLRSEREAREQLTREWANFSAADRAQCTQTASMGGLPSYVELITCLEVLEHVYSWDRAFANLAELLAPGGQALVTCPHVYPLHEEPYDFWRPTPYAFQRAAEAADLSCTRIIKAGDLWDVIGTLLGGAQALPVDRSLRSRLTTRAVRRGCDKLVTALARGSLRRRTSLTGNTYLSAVVVLQKAS